MEKNIRDYPIHLYLGCKMTSGKFTGTLQQIQYHPTDNTYDWYMVSCSDWEETDFSKYKLLLRPLSDITEEERKEYESIGEVEYRYSNGVIYHNGTEVYYLLSKGFDLFGLIPAGLAIDATTISRSKK